jgi:alanine-glyoxylate transaminase/serine-glyoxylate transaminase/serine-pyruvate transaminase
MEKLTPPTRLLLGPGPSNVSQRVLDAMHLPLIGHLDPAFLEIMDSVQVQLRKLFGTANAFTLPLSATGSAGMEACFVNLLEAGDRVVVGVNGVFGTRMCEVARRCGAEVTAVEAEWGKPLDPTQMVAAIETAQPQVVAFVHAETSTGVCQPVEEITRAAKAAGALTILDCVTSLAGIPLHIDEWQVDAVYSGTQKCLSCPPGLSPVSFSPQALERVAQRKTPVQSWYLDTSLLGSYYGGGKRAYHHTAPISAIYAIYEGLRIVEEEGMDSRSERHYKAAEALITGLEPLGLSPLVEKKFRLPMLTTVRLPEALQGDPEAALRGKLLKEFNIEVGGGLGALAGKVWRIGLMGENAKLEKVEQLISVLRKIL